MSVPFRQAVCNEVFQKHPLAGACKTIRELGYDGIEIAHFTLADDPQAITPGQRQEYRRVMESEGLTFVGLHWLMVAPKGLHVTTADRALWKRSWEHIRHLIDLCGDLGENGVLVFGSPHQRSTTGGMEREEATQRYVEGLVHVAPEAQQRGVTILIEALPRNQTDVINSLDEAAGLVRQIGSPAVQTMFDTHNAVDETEPHASLIHKYRDIIRHVHVNETDGRYPGTGDYDFQSVFQALHEIDYKGWVSLEVFDFQPDAVTISRESLAYLRQAEDATQNG